MKCQGFSHECDSDDAVRFRMKTQYVEEESNFAVLCSSCQKESDEHWQDMWDEYYKGCL